MLSHFEWLLIATINSQNICNFEIIVEVKAKINIGKLYIIYTKDSCLEECLEILNKF